MAFCLTSVSLLVPAVRSLPAIVVVAMLGGCVRLSPVWTDETAPIRSLCGTTYVCERPMFVTEEEGVVMLKTGRYFGDFPRSMAGYRRPGAKWPDFIKYALEPGTQFRIDRMLTRKSDLIATGYYLKVSVVSGEHAGKQFIMPADEIMSEDPIGKWGLEPFIRPASVTTKSAGT